MGAYSPAPVVTDAVHEQVMRQVILPTVKGMAAEGHPYTGFLYAGLMIDVEGNPSVIEYNCRFGDPETQPIMHRLQSDLGALCLAAMDPSSGSGVCGLGSTARRRRRTRCRRLSGAYEKGQAIQGLDRDWPPTTKVFHAGTRRK